MNWVCYNHKKEQQQESWQWEQQQWRTSDCRSFNLAFLFEQRKLLLIAWNAKPTTYNSIQFPSTFPQTSPLSTLHSSNGFRWRGSFWYVFLITLMTSKAALFMAKMRRVLGLKSSLVYVCVSVCGVLGGLRGLCRLFGVRAQFNGLGNEQRHLTAPSQQTAWVTTIATWRTATATATTTVRATNVCWAGQAWPS